MDLRVYAQRSRFWVQEFLVELLGCLVPGLIFTFLTVIAAIVMIWTIVRLYGGLDHDSRSGPAVRTQGQTMAEKGSGPTPDGSQNMPTDSAQGQAPGGRERRSSETYRSLWETFGAEIVILAIACSYVIGFLFFRADPRLPDTRSVWVNRKRLIADEAPAIYLDPGVKGDWRLMGRPTINAIESFLGMRPRYVGQLEKERRIEVEFPYLNMRNYLLHRNLKHLADIITWDAKDGESRRPKTTAFINALKIRLEFALPDKYGAIRRNEAHIRLMSSVWYMARLVQWLALVNMGLVVLAAFTVSPHYVVFEGQEWQLSAPCLGWWGLVVAAMWYARARIENSLHYQRVREILYVLETAHFATVCGIPISESGQQTRYPEILRDLGEKKDDSANPPSSA